MPHIQTNTDIPPSDQKLALEKKLEENLQFFSKALSIGKSYDVVLRKMEFAGKDFGILYINGFVKDHILSDILRYLSTLEREQLVSDVLQNLLSTYMAHIQVSAVKTTAEVVSAVLTGQTAFLIDTIDQALIVDARQYPNRTPEEPDLEKVVRGARDGFVETLVINTVMTRRRIRDPRLIFENMKIGVRSKTDIAVAYIQDVADPNLVKEIKQRLEKIEVDGIPMAEKSVEEFLVQKGWNPYPVVRYTERPDVAAIHLLEGHVLIYVDTSPSVMITPATFFHHLQHAEEYRNNPAVGGYIRMVRLFAVLASVFLVPLWLLFAVFHRDWLPHGLTFIGPEKSAKVPIALQFILADLGLDMMRMAAIHTPTPLATAMGLIAAVLIGQIAVGVGLFNNETILYLAIAVLGMYATPSYEVGMANRLIRLGLIVAVWAFKLPGLIIGVGLWMLLLFTTQSVGRPYMWPLFPLEIGAFLDLFIRSPIQRINKRPAIVRPQDPDRQPN
ncbi:spore germination protein [Effusibacillus dendaii]|uniref:Spore germination protein n=1 Tax=Effusibacillus dendaii TaxID=2743772 RepID=A0A7I8D6Q2_9BACL|nr:spore germination protein [Effusibacillus dendaii]BCJ85808.1 spore germination protein [Effusibacillus dendaii]